MFLLRREFRDFCQKHISARIAIPNGQHRLYPCGLISFGCNNFTNTIPLVYGPTNKQDTTINKQDTTIIPTIPWERLHSIPKDSPIFRKTAVNIIDVIATTDTTTIQQIAPILQKFGKTMQEASKKSIHFILRDHVDSVIQELLQSEKIVNLTFQNFLSESINQTKDLANVIANNVRELLSIIEADIKKNHSSIKKDIFGYYVQDWEKQLKKMILAIQKKGYGASFVTGKCNYYRPNAGIPRRYMWIGEFFRIIIHDRQTIIAADKFLSYAYPKVKQFTQQPLPIHCYTDPDWFSHMVGFIAVKVSDRIFDILVQECTIKGYFRNRDSVTFYPIMRRRIEVVIKNNVIRDILETIIHYGMDPIIEEGHNMFIKRNQETNYLHWYLE